jgi:hypothetical protein
VESSKQIKRSHFDYNYDILKDSKYFTERDGFFGVNRFLNSVKFIIILINLLNTGLFLFKTRKYTVFNKEKLTGRTENAVKITKDGESRNKIVKFLRNLCFKNAYDNDEDEIESYWELNIWNPSKFSTHLFVSFPPFNVAFLWLSPPSFTNLIYLFMTSIILYFVIIQGYITLINDKQTLYQETFDEYQRKFVRPKLSVSTREVAIDATRGPYDTSNSTIQYYSPGLTEKIFKFHDFKGEESVEKFDHGEFTPVKKSRSSMAVPVPSALRQQVFNTPREKRYTSYHPSPLARKNIDRHI